MSSSPKNLLEIRISARVSAKTKEVLRAHTEDAATSEVLVQ